MIRQKYGVIQNVRHSGKRGGKTDRKVTKNYVGEGFAAKKCDATHSKKNKKQKKNEILRVTFFLMLTYFAGFFVSVFVDDVISFL